MHLREWLGCAWVNFAGNPPSFEDDVLSAVAERLGSLEVIDGYGGEAFEKFSALEEGRDRKYYAITECGLASCQGNGRHRP
jgi:hypothetical protein